MRSIDLRCEEYSLMALVHFYALLHASFISSKTWMMPVQVEPLATALSFYNLQADPTDTSIPISALKRHEKILVPRQFQFISSGTYVLHLQKTFYRVLAFLKKVIPSNFKIEK